MQSRKDLVQAYFFVVGRLTSALTHGKPDLLDPPNRRFSTAGTLGVLLSGLLVAIFWIIGLYSPSPNTSWQVPGAIVMDADTGARYIYLDGHLRPVLNYTSARLAVGGSGAPVTVKQVSAQSLAGAPVGTPIGIPGAPDSPPPPGGLDGGAWTVCLRFPDGQSTGPSVSLLLGQSIGTELTENDGMLVTDPDQTVYLLWQGHRYRLPSTAVIGAIGYSGVVPLPVPANWLSPIPAGRDITLPDIPDTGAPGPVIHGKQTVIGQIYEVRNPAINSDDLYVLRSDGLSRINRTTEALLLSAPSVRRAYPGGDVEPIQGPPDLLVGAPLSDRTDLVTAYPAPLPNLVNAAVGTAMSPCVRYTPSKDGHPLAVAFLTAQAGAITARAVSTATHTTGETVDQVAIPQGSGVLARDIPATGSTLGTEYLITDAGAKFPLVDQTVLTTLGYSADAVVDIPGQLLALLPTGPALSQQAALASQQVGSG